MPKNIEYYTLKIISSSLKGPHIAEQMADELTKSIIQQRKGKKNFFKENKENKQLQQLQNLYMSITLVSKQTTPDLESKYKKVLDRIHDTGLNSFFTNELPASTLISSPPE